MDVFTVFTIDKGTLESAIAIVPRYVLNNRHFPDNTNTRMQRVHSAPIRVTL